MAEGHSDARYRFGAGGNWIDYREGIGVPSQDAVKSRSAKSIFVSFLWVFICVNVHASETFTNPIVASGADPWIIYRDGYYYLTYTTGSNVQIHRAPRLTGTNGIGRAAVSSVFYPPAPFNRDVWAPELHFLRGKAYVYYAADDGNNANHRMFVAESQATGPNFSFTAKGKIADPMSDRWAIDGTVLEAANGALYFIWSGWPGAQDGLQNLYISPMRDPLTLSGPRVLLSTPNLPWESWIQEGPEVLQRHGKVFIIYASNLSWTDNECLGMLSNSDGNYLNPGSWTKSSLPVFASSAGTNRAVYGPGHAGFTHSLDGQEDWIVYHAAKQRGSGWDRNIRMQSFNWTNEYPFFGQPVPAGVPLPIPSGDAATPPRFVAIRNEPNGDVSILAAGPLPLTTNQWSLECSQDLANWTTASNMPGLQFQMEYRHNPMSSAAFFRIHSTR